ncbi:hypothetical protein RFI_15269, partial [Reticulomyxa filosa]
HSHERREESEMELYCGLKNVRLENIKEIKFGFFISHVSTSDDIQVAQTFRSAQGCILHFHPSMRRSNQIPSCDASWISPFKREREILFSRSSINSFFDEKIYKEEHSWNAKVESEDEYTQIILLTWTLYDQYIQQTMQISAMWDHVIDLNLIFSVLIGHSNRDINEAFKILFEFEEWKIRDNNQQKYKEKTSEFLKQRCCNHNVNLFCMFLSEKLKKADIGLAIIYTAVNGLPFVEKDKEALIKNKIC